MQLMMEDLSPWKNYLINLLAIIDLLGNRVIIVIV